MRWLTFILVPLLVCLSANPGLAQGPGLTVTNPSSGLTINGNTVVVNFQTSGFSLVPSSVPLSEAGKHPEVNKTGEGHLHLTLDLQPMLVWDRNEPYTFSNVPPGEHQLVIELANNDHGSLIPPVLRTVQFRTVGSQGTPGLGTPAMGGMPGQPIATPSVSPTTTAPRPSRLPRTGGEWPVALLGTMAALGLGTIMLLAGCVARRHP